MREIKFRAKDIESGEWWYGSHFTDSGEDYIIPQNLLSIKDYEKYQVNQNTVGEFTGLYDKNGKDIYEGDIVKHNFSNNVFGVVKWHPLGYFYINVHWDKCETEFGYLPLGEVMHRIVNGKKIEIEVIGDIYDNPELLNKE